MQVPAMIDATHDSGRRSWIASADGHPDFPIQNLPLGVFSPSDGCPRSGVAIGDEILDLAAALALDLFDGEARQAAKAASKATLNAFLALGAGPRRVLRARLSNLFTLDCAEQSKVAACLRSARDCTLHLPATIGDYTDFYVGIHHATNVGKLFRPDNPLLPNYKWVPIGYHGRASTVRPSGTPVHRPAGQRKRPEETAPSFGPCRNLDYELELGVWIGPGNDHGNPIPIGQAADHVAGYCLLNDWSARDIQAWEYQPLGPFLSKSFVTTISAWIVTPEALVPFRVAQPGRPEGDPAPLDYLLDETDQRTGAFDIELEVLLLTERMRAAGREPHRLSIGSTRHMYWTVAQMVAHHTSNGCSLRPGDLLGSGTISAPTQDGYGSLLEISRGGKELFALPDGETRSFLEDGDEVFLRARAQREGAASIGFGECRAVVLPAEQADAQG
jgi:fumarylacetoacetase